MLGLYFSGDQGISIALLLHLGGHNAEIGILPLELVIYLLVYLSYVVLISVLLHAVDLLGRLFDLL